MYQQSTIFDAIAANSRKKMKVHYSSKSNEWGTPQEFFDKLNHEFAFTIDVAATPENAKCPRFYTADDNGLTQDWAGERVWVNPPYGRDIGKWIKKAATEKSEITVMLIPARTDTKAWHEYIFGKAEIRFIQGRLAFICGADQQRGNAPFPSAIIIFRNGDGNA